MSKQIEDKIGCVGKVPTQQDLFKYNLHSKNTKFLENWIQEGFIHTTRDRIIRNQPHEAFGLSHGLLLNYGVGRSPIMGYLTDSVDSRGRYFPLLLFNELMHPDIVEVQHLIPSIYRDTYKNFYAFAEQKQGIENTDSFIEQFDNFKTVNVITDTKQTKKYYNQEFANIDYVSLWREIVKENLTNVSDNILQVFVAIVKSIGSQGVWQLKLPIARAPFTATTICFWLSILKAIQALNYRNIHLAWQMNNKQKTLYLTIYHGSLSIAFFRSLVSNADVRIRQINLMDYLSTNEKQTVSKYQITESTTLQSILKHFSTLKIKRLV